VSDTRTPKPWVYIRSEPGLWTVGFYDPSGKWQSDSDHESSESAAERVGYLSGRQFNESLTINYEIAREAAARSGDYLRELDALTNKHVKLQEQRNAMVAVLQGCRTRLRGIGAGRIAPHNVDDALEDIEAALKAAKVSP
jgi:hypothetical protein